MGKYDNRLPLQVQDVGQVQSVTNVCANVQTGYGSQITVYWSSGKPDPLPRVGEVWYVERFATDRWRFVAKASASKYNRLSYGVLVNATTANGKESAIVDDVVKGGFDSVYLVVADNGLLAWDYDGAEGVGLVPGGLTLRRLMDRFDHLSVPVTLCIKSDLWGDPADYRHNMYQQARIMSDDTVRYVPRFSWAAAREAMSRIVRDLFSRWGSQARGICFVGVGNYSDDCDFSSAMQGIYSELTGEVVSYSLYDGDLNEQSWHKPHLDWFTAEATAINRFVKDLRDIVGSWGLSFIADSGYLAIDGGRFGQARTGIPDGVSQQPWSALGAELSFGRSSDSAGQMRSFEVSVALQKRLSGLKATLPMLNLRDFREYDAPFSMLAKYGITEVVIDGYDYWRLLSDDEAIALSDSMNHWRVSEMSTGLSVGVALSSHTFLTAVWDRKNAGSLRQSLDDCMATVIDRVPHRIQFLFDEDLGSPPDDLACLVLFETLAMTDEDVAFSLSWKESRPIVMVGQCASYDFLMAARPSNPLSVAFGENFTDTRDYLDQVSLDGGFVDSWDSVYVLTGTGSEGYIPHRNRFDATGMVDAPSGGIMPAPAPILFDGRSSLMAVDVIGDSMLPAVVGELVLYSLGRV